jgi:hypothetical protein
MLLFCLWENDLVVNSRQKQSGGTKSQERGLVPSFIHKLPSVQDGVGINTGHFLCPLCQVYRIHEEVKMIQGSLVDYVSFVSCEIVRLLFKCHLVMYTYYLLLVM